MPNDEFKAGNASGDPLVHIYEGGDVCLFVCQVFLVLVIEILGEKRRLRGGL